MDPKLEELLSAALAKTETKSLQWDGFDSETFRARIGEGYLHLTRGMTDLADGDGDAVSTTTYFVHISDDLGRTVAEEEVLRYSPDFQLLDKLFSSARKSALKSEKVLDKMLQTLLGTPK